MWKYALLALMVTMPAYAADIATKRVQLRGMDKITGRISTMDAQVGEPITFGDLKITVQRCLTKPPEETPENSAYLNVVETNAKGELKEVFQGWMFSSNPALSAMEHPVYDVWVLQCLTGKVVAPIVKANEVKRDTAPEEALNEPVVEDDNPSLAEDEAPSGQ